MINGFMSGSLPKSVRKQFPRGFSFDRPDEEGQEIVPSFEEQNKLQGLQQTPNQIPAPMDADESKSPEIMMGRAEKKPFSEPGVSTGVKKPFGETGFGKAMKYILPIISGAALVGMGGGPIALGGLMGGMGVGVKRKEEAEAQKKYDLELLKANEAPADIQSFRAFQNMSPDQKSEFLRMKAASTVVGQPFRDRAADDARDARAQIEDERRTAKAELESNKAIERLSGDIGDSAKLQESLKNVESMMGFKLGEYDPTTGEAGGKKIDLPGVNIPGLGRTSFYSKPARELDAAVQNVFNVELKDRSGAAITSNEMERIKKEFSDGKYTTESEKLGALKRYQKELRKVLISKEAAYTPENVAAFAGRGGVTSGISKEDRTAINWARQNTNNPMASQILLKHGVE